MKEGIEKISNFILSFLEIENERSKSKKRKRSDESELAVKKNKIDEENTTGILALPDELLLEFMQYLSPSELARVSSVCKRFARVSNTDLLWNELAWRKGIPLVRFSRSYFDNDGREIGETLGISSKEEFKLGLTECEYPPEFIELFGSKEAVEALPLLKYEGGKVNAWDSFDNFGKLLPLHLQGHTIMRGIGITCESSEGALISRHFPFIAFCIKKIKENEEDAPTLAVQLFFKRNNYFWLQEDNAGSGTPSKYGALDYFRELMKGEVFAPTMRVFYRSDHGGMVQLTDQSEFEQKQLSSPRATNF